MFTPSSLNDFHFTRAADKRLLENILKGSTTFPTQGVNALCFYGGFGTGKTTLASVFPTLFDASRPHAGALYHSQKATTLIKCGSAGYMATIQKVERSLGAGEVNLSAAGFHYFIFDEAEALDSRAQKPLRSILSAAENAVFMFTTNDLSALDGGIRDRCHKIEMNMPRPSEILPIAVNMLAGMNKSLAQADIDQIAATVRSLRQLETELQRAEPQ